MDSLYASPGYAASFAPAFTVVALPRSGGHLLARLWRDAGHDLMAPYPLLDVHDWSALPDDLEALSGQYPSVVGVTDSLAKVDPATLATAFPDLCRPFKQHYVVDLQNRPAEHFSKHHQRYIRAAARQVEIDEINGLDYLDTWCALYDELITRHEITGVATFSRASFAAQLALPACRAFAARTPDGEIVGMMLIAMAGTSAHYHLAAYSPRGYELKASFALFDFVIRVLAWESYDFLNLGGGAGFTDDPQDGLAQFKRGWASLTRTSYLVGRILDPARYAAWHAAAGGQPTSFFPAYRAPTRS